jgi:hypothetical protein
MAAFFITAEKRRNGATQRLPGGNLATIRAAGRGKVRNSDNFLRNV